jgi:hypothetical protein
MKTSCFGALALLALFLAGCASSTDIVVTGNGTESSFKPTAVTATMSKGDTVTFVNKDSRAHVIVIGPAPAVGAWPASDSPAKPTLPDGKPNPIYASSTSLQLSAAGTPGDTVVWKVPAGTMAPLTLYWRCIVPGHAGTESGTIDVKY